MKRDIARELFRSYRSGLRKKKELPQEDRVDLSDPQKIGSILSEIVEARDWRKGNAEVS